MAKLTVGFVKKYNSEQQKLLMEYVEIDKDKVIEIGNPLELIPKEKIPEFSQKMQEIEYKYICKLYDVEYNDDMDFMKLSELLKRFKKEYKLKTASFGELIQKFQ